MEIVMKRLWRIAGAAALAAICICGPAVGQAANKDFGRREYMSNCAVCHGVDGQGKGPLYATGFLAREPTDLTRLASANRGVFPFERLYQVIDGRQAVAAHGPRDMPVWGDEYYEEGAFPDVLGVVNPEAYVRARILALIDYLARMQASR
jgi:mono/diheme cytochrome c family protein